jgi:hypothetical protein
VDKAKVVANYRQDNYAIGAPLAHAATTSPLLKPCLKMPGSPSLPRSVTR